MRFFHRFTSMNYRFTGLVNGILLNVSKKRKYTSAIDYLSRYAYAVDNDLLVQVSEDYKNIIWQCWFQGADNMPEIVKTCTDSVKKYHGKDIIFLDNSNIMKYVDLPEYIIQKHKNGIIKESAFSDICRMYLLYKYGGTWVDATIFLTGEIPKDILESDFFTFRSRESCFLKHINNIEQFKMYSNNFNKIISFESPYFIHAKPGNPIIKGLLNLFLEYWKHENTVKDYLMIDKFFVLTLLSDKKLKNDFIEMPVYYLENVLLLLHVLFEQYDELLYENIVSMSNLHKLTHKNLHRNPYKNSFLKKLFVG